MLLLCYAIHTLLQVTRKHPSVYNSKRSSLLTGHQRNEKNGDENSRTSAFMNVEAWRKNENTSSFDRLVKGALLTVEGYFKPEEWQDAEGVKHNRVILVATKFYEAVEKENTPDSQQGKTQKDK